MKKGKAHWRTLRMRVYVGNDLVEEHEQTIIPQKRKAQQDDLHREFRRALERHLRDA